MLKQSLFGFPIIKTHIDKNLYDKDIIVGDMLRNYDLDNNRNHWDTVKHGIPTSNLHHSVCDDGNKFKQINFSKLIPVYNKVIGECLNQIYFKQKVNFKYSIANYTCVKENHSMREHNHIDSDFAAVHYVKFNKEEHYSTNFINTHKHGGFSGELFPNLTSSLDTSRTDNSWLCYDYRIDTNEDDFVMVPSVVEHSIPYHKNCKEHRITIALNISIEK